MTNLRLINLLIAALFCAITASAATLPKRKYPGGKCYISFGLSKGNIYPPIEVVLVGLDEL